MLILRLHYFNVDSIKELNVHFSNGIGNVF